MVSPEGTILLFLLIAIGLGIFVLFLSYLLRMKGSPDVDKTVYECGEAPFGTARVQYNARYYVFALVYVIFAVEAIFLLPWAASLRGTGDRVLMLAEMMIFIAILAVGLGYAWKRGALEWQ